MLYVRNSYLRVVTNLFIFSLTKSTNQGPRVWKTEDIPANKISIAWQLPQYILVSAGEVMFSVTGLEFSYSQVGLCKWKVKIDILLQGCPTFWLL